MAFRNQGNQDRSKVKSPSGMMMKGSPGETAVCVKQRERIAENGTEDGGTAGRRSPAFQGHYFHSIKMS